MGDVTLKCLLTGGNAFVSEVIGPALVAAGHELTVCIRPGRPVPAWVDANPEAVTTRAADLADGSSLTDLVAGHALIVHAAGKVEDPATPKTAFERNNTLATRALINAAIETGCAGMINFSSISVYGEIDVPVVDAATPSTNPTPYGASKLAAEEALRHAAPKLPSISLRAPGIVGPNAHGNWLARSRAAMRAGEPVTISNPNFPFNNAVHVDDLGRFVVSLCARDWSGFHAFPLGAGEPLTILDLMERLKVATGSTSSITISDAKRSPFSISSDTAIHDFGYKPASMADIIDRFASDA